MFSQLSLIKRLYDTKLSFRDNKNDFTEIYNRSLKQMAYNSSSFIIYYI